MYIKVKVLAGVRKETFKKISDDHFEVSVKEKAERNMANMRVLELVANYFAIAPNKVRIISGHHSSGKIFDINTN